MHEWALAESVIKTAAQVAEKESMKHITQVIVRLGELQQINEEIFHFALDEIMKSYPDRFKQAKIIIEIEPSELRCHRCKHQWPFDEMKKQLDPNDSEAVHFIPEVAFVHTRCPKCGSPDFEIIKGRGVTLASIQGEQEDED